MRYQLLVPDPIKTFYRYFPVADRDRDWGLFATTVGESRIGPGIEYPPSGHPKGYDFRSKAGRVLTDCQIIYISAGGGWFESGTTKRVSISAGDLIFLFPGVWHSYAPKKDTGWDEHWIGFDGTIAKRLMKHGFFDPSKPVLRAAREQRLMAWFKELVEVTQSNDPALQQTMAGIIMRVLGHLYSSQQSRLTGDDRELQIIRQAVMRLEQLFTTEIDFADLAQEFNVSYSWFRQAFAHHTGLAPHKYLLEMRLAHARELLAGTSLSIKEISDRIGFVDPQYFCRLFRRRVGLTPTDWRRRALNQKVQ